MAPHRVLPICVLLLPALLSGGSADAAKLEVGPGKTYAKPSAAIAAAQPGDVIEIASGTYTDDPAVITSELTIVGVGPTRPHLEATTPIANGKGILVINAGVGPVVIERLELSGARVADKNGAGIRMQGSDLTVRDCYFHDNENGILSGGTAGAKVLIEQSEFAENGRAGSGQQHNVYISGDTAELTFRYNYSHGAKSGHNLKSRAKVNYVLYNRLMDEASGTSSYTVDLPQGGRSYLIGNLLQMGPKAENTGTLVSYNRESPTNPELELHVVNNTFVNDRPDKTPAFLRAGQVDTITIKNNLFVGPGKVLEAEAGSPTVDESGNLASDAPGLVDRAGYDYRLAAGSPAIDQGTAPGSAAGFDLTPLFHYVHPRQKQPRPAVGALDVGAYEHGVAAPAADGGPAADAGVSDGAAPTVDGGAEVDGTVGPARDATADSDGGAPPAGDGGDPGGVDADGGCCALAGQQPAGGAGAALLPLLLLAVIGRRRRRS